MKTTEQKVAVMQAYLDGKTISITAKQNIKVLRTFKRSDGTGDPEWNWNDLDYEVVREKIVRFAIVYGNRIIRSPQKCNELFFKSEEAAINYAKQLPNPGETVKIIKVEEVTDE